MFVFRILAVCVCALIFASAVLADTSELLFPEPTACESQPIDPSIESAEQRRWSECEKWVWSCIRDGKEANLFDKSQCLTPRTLENNTLRRALKMAMFRHPERYATSNAVSADFLYTILTKPHYIAQIAPVGIRIFGGYFKDPINLENLSTQINLVIDGSKLDRGLRMTNFRTDKNISLDGSNVQGSIYLMRSRISGSLFLEAGVYDYLDLNDAHIGASLEASSSVFNDEVRIHRAKIAGKVIFTKARLTTLSGWSAEIGSSLEMRLADVRFGVDLSGSHVAGDVRMQDVTFGRHQSDTSYVCTWDPNLPFKNVLHELRQAIPDPEFATVWRQLVIDRPSNASGTKENVCKAAHSTDPAVPSVLSDRNSVFLRDMKIDGSLCLVDVTGEIPVSGSGKVLRSIGKVAIDGTVANSTILSWKTKSASETLWYLANYKTKYLLANIENPPKLHYTDNIEVGSLSMLKRSAIYAGSLGHDSSRTDEYRVREKCDVTPSIGNSENMADPAVQARIIDYFNTDKSESSQPFANIVARIDSMSVNTTQMRIALSEHKNRNACSSSQLARRWHELPWASLSDRIRNISLEEARKFVLDGVCKAGLLGLKYSVSYGHEPHNLVFLILGFIVVFALLLRLDRRSEDADAPTQRLGLTYALDNLIPLKPYRVNKELADLRPNRKILRAYLVLHRMLGVLIAVLAFFFVYKASQ